MSDPSFKVVLLGEGSVGKTSLLLRYVRNEYSSDHVQTVQASFLPKRVTLEGKSARLLIWDTAGQERFHALGPIYYRDAHGALLVYDITDKESFDRVQVWVKELRKMLGNDIVLSIAGNKVDLDRNRVVELQEAEDYAASVGAKHYLTSAKLNKGIEEMFKDIAKRLLEVPLKEVEPRRGIVPDPLPPKKKNDGCCGSD
ncbi:Ras-related protein Rab-21 [Pelomyxa schiedti]|nr:Ras-related protein Rab-21 [Pelomyxa schiedti]